MPTCRRHTPAAGFTIIEVLITTFIISTILTGVFGLFVLSLRSAQIGENRVAAIALANERMEMIRNLPYLNVGTSGGVPAGSIPQEETVTRNGLSYTVRTDIRYIDDPYDGQAAGGTQNQERVTICHKAGTPGQQTIVVDASSLDAHLAHGDVQGSCDGGDSTPPGDEYNADYKQVRVEVSWNSQYTISPVLLITDIAPAGIEGGEQGGTLDFTALDANGNPVESATVHLVNSTVSPAIDVNTETNVEGRVVLPGLTESADSYQLSVSKTGYTSETTYDQTATFLPSPDYSNLSMISREVTKKTFFIDQIATLNIHAQDEDKAKKITNLSYTLRGSKTIGVDDTAALVYKVDRTNQTDNKGDATEDNLDWDSYNVTVDGAATGYDIKESDPPLPLTLDPNQTQDLTLTLTPHTDISLHVTVTDSNNTPVDNATVHLTDNGVDQSLGSGVLGQVFFSDLPVDGDYTIDVSAPGFTDANTTVQVAGTSSTTIQLSAS